MLIIHKNADYYQCRLDLSTLKCRLSVFFSCYIFWANHFSNFHFNYIRVFFKNGSSRRTLLSITRTIWEGQSFLGNKEFLAGESCEGAGQFFDLQCQINTLLHVGYLKLKDTGTVYERNINQINNIEKQN